MKSISLPLILLLFCLFVQVSSYAQSREGLDPTIRSDATIQVADHVYMIPDEKKPIIPNVGFVVGDRATLVIDTGLGETNGRIVLGEAQELSETNRFYVAATHTHPEHDLGAMGFPDDATIVRSSRQQADIEEFGMGLAERFATFSARSAELLEGAVIRPSDLVFEGSITLDLGGVHVKMMQVGPTHTRGDLVFYVVEDEVLFTGDVVMNAFPMPISPTSSIHQWLKTLDHLEALNPKLIIPSHYAVGAADMIETYRDYFMLVQSRVSAMAKEGKTADDVRDQLVEEISAQYSQWPDPNKIRSSINTAFRELEGQ